MNTQFKLHATVSNELADALESYFLENELMDWGLLQKERHDPYEVFGIFPDSDTAYEALAELRAAFPELPENITGKIIADSDWQNAYKDFLKPWNDRLLHWIPLWERETYSAPAGAACVYLDSGMAFGTGAHETTRLCARRLIDYHEAPVRSLATCRLIDAGCGSGILALSAAALGFKDVSAFDIDPEAIAVCQKNADENPHLRAPQFTIADLEKGLHGERADLVLANIQTDILIPFRFQLVQSVTSSGILVLSGILNHEAESVRTHYETEFARLHPETTVQIDSRQDGEWSDLQFRLAKAPQ